MILSTTEDIEIYKDTAITGHLDVDGNVNTTQISNK